jgi:tRNA (cytosine40_48-C5)-methyltransferase
MDPALAAIAATLAERVGADHAERIAAGWAAPAAPALRANRIRTTPEALVAELAAAGITVTPAPLGGDCFTTDAQGERAVRGSAANAAGRLYLQTLGSQLPGLLGALPPGTRILDACAAPGGKTTQLAARAGATCPLVAVEMSAVRMQKLRHTLARQGATWVTTVAADARSLPGTVRRTPFDHILVDAPCTGTGTISAGDARTWAHLAGRYAGYAAIKASQQTGILAATAALAAPGGRLVYSTCAVDPLENEAVIDAFLAGGAWRLADASAWRERMPGTVDPVAELAGRHLHPDIPHCCLRWLPGPDGDGGFAALLVRS